MPPAMRQGGRLVVVGGVAAGMSAASKARRLRPDIEIVVLEKGRDVSYGACSLPYYISGVVRDRSDLVAYTADRFRSERRIDVRLSVEATALDPRARRVDCVDRATGCETSLEYDALVLATGASAVVPPIPGADLPGVFALRTLDDGDRIIEYLDGDSVSSATIVGGGYIGLEMAESLAARGLAVTVIELLPDVLSTYDPDMSRIVREELLARDVVLRTGTKVEALEPGDGSAVGYVVAAGQRLRTDMVLLSVGVRPETRLATAAGIALGKTGAIAVDAWQATDAPFVFAAGDCSEARHTVTRRPVWIPLGTTANKQGRVAGENAIGGRRRFPGVAGTNATKIFSLEAAQTGLSSRGANEEGFDHDSVSITALTRSGSYPGSRKLRVKLIFEKGEGRLLGAQMIGREGAAKRIDAVAVALSGGMSVRDLASVDMSYAPPFAPVWDPVLVAANRAVAKLES